MIRNTIQIMLISACIFPLFAQLKEFDVRTEPASAAIPVFPANPDDAALIIHSSILDLSFESNMDGIVSDKSSPSEGKYILIVKTLKQIITIKSKGYKEAKLRVPVMEPKTVAYYKIETRENPGSIILKTVPDGATIKINEMPETTFVSPAVINDLDPMPYTLRISKINYESRDTIVNVDAGQQSEVTMELSAQRGFLTVTSEPKGADVYLNGKKTGITPFNEPVNAGKYSVEVRKESFITQSKQLVVEYNKKAAAEFDLTSKYAAKVKFWRTTRAVSLISTILPGGVAIITGLLANQADRNYHKSTDADKILEFKNQVILYDKVWEGATIGACSLAAFTLISHFEVRMFERADKQLSLNCNPMEFKLSLEYKF